MTHRKTLAQALFVSLCFFSLNSTAAAQDLTYGLAVNDLSDKPMQDIDKPAYLDSIIDPSFGTIIRRISDAGTGGVIKPMYSTIQAWNADESRMILYDQRTGDHQLLNGTTYEFIRNLDDVYPADLEQLFWHSDDPNLLTYLDRPTRDLIRYNVNTQEKVVLANFIDLSGCTSNISLGNDVQMLSRDSDRVGFRCGNTEAYMYTISTGELLELAVSDVYWAAPSIAPSGNLMLHRRSVYNSDGDFVVDINAGGSEHSSIGQLSNGNDAHFAISFAQGPSGGCLADIVAHDLTDGSCFEITGSDNGYDYPKSGTHISALAHQNDIGGWVAASMVGYDEDGQSLLDQEIIVANSDPNDLKVVRVAHHRSDENEFDYWGEPHVTISPTGTRLLFGSDWSGSEDGNSVDAYVVELPAYQGVPLPIENLQFHGEFLGKEGVHLFWSTEAEIDHNGFEIETFSFGYWETITFVEGEGGIHQGARYEYLYADINPGLNRFRLRLIDNDGTSSYSNEIEVLADLPNEIGMTSIYPNPIGHSGRINLSVGQSQEMKVNIFDNTGKWVAEVFSGYLNPNETHQIQIDGSGMSPGLYHVVARGLSTKRKAFVISK